MIECQITCKSLKKSSKCQNFLRVWHFCLLPILQVTLKKQHLLSVSRFSHHVKEGGPSTWGVPVSKINRSSDIARFVTIYFCTKKFTLSDLPFQKLKLLPHVTIGLDLNCSPNWTSALQKYLQCFCCPCQFKNISESEAYTNEEYLSWQHCE